MWPRILLSIQEKPRKPYTVNPLTPRWFETRKHRSKFLIFWPVCNLLGWVGSRPLKGTYSFYTNGTIISTLIGVKTNNLCVYEAKIVICLFSQKYMVLLCKTEFDFETVTIMKIFLWDLHKFKFILYQMWWHRSKCWKNNIICTVILYVLFSRFWVIECLVQFL